MEDFAAAHGGSTDLPWLAELARAGAPAGAGGARRLAVAVRRLGARRRLAAAAAVAADDGEPLGVDLVHAAVNELLAQRAWPQVVVANVAAPPGGGLAVAIVAGIVRACCSHGLELIVPLAVETPHVDVGLCVLGAVAGAPAAAPRAGDVVLGLRGRGPSDGDHAPLLAEAARRGLAPTDRLANGDTIARTLLSPRASHASVLHDPVKQGWPFSGCAIGDGTLAAQVRAALPPELDVVLDFAGWRPPAPFCEWFADAPGRLAAAERTSAGCDLALVVAAADAPRFLAHFAAWGEPGATIGRIVPLAASGATAR